MCLMSNNCVSFAEGVNACERNCAAIPRGDDTTSPMPVGAIECVYISSVLVRNLSFGCDSVMGTAAGHWLRWLAVWTRRDRGIYVACPCRRIAGCRRTG